MTRAEIVRRLMVERFGPPQVLARERWLPVPAYRDRMCVDGPSVYQKVLEDAVRLQRLEEDAA